MLKKTDYFEFSVKYTSGREIYNYSGKLPEEFIENIDTNYYVNLNTFQLVNSDPKCGVFTDTFQPTRKESPKPINYNNSYDETVLLCSVCGAANSFGQKFCKACGLPFSY